MQMKAGASGKADTLHKPRVLTASKSVNGLPFAHARARVSLSKLPRPFRHPSRFDLQKIGDWSNSVFTLAAFRGEPSTLPRLLNVNFC